MQIRFLSIVHDGIFLLGYPLKLSPTEEKLLKEVANGGRCGVAELSKLLTDGVSSGNIAVHINSINRKAKKISARKLIIYEKGSYKINELM